MENKINPSSTTDGTTPSGAVTETEAETGTAATPTSYATGFDEKTSGKVYTHEISPYMSATVDLFRGNLLIGFKDAESIGSRMPVSIHHHFNSAVAGSRYMPSDSLRIADYSLTALGAGWRLNLMQSLVAANDGFVYTDESGESHFLTVGIPAHLYQTADGSITYNIEKHELCVGNEILLFTPEGKLHSITDENGNSMFITYNDRGQISTVTDGADRSFIFECTPYYLRKITAPNGETVTVNTTGNRLTQIWHTDGSMELIDYECDENSYLPTSITYRDSKGCNNHLITYSYDSTRVTSVKEYGYDASGNALLMKETQFAYSDDGLCTKMTVAGNEDTATATTVCLFDHSGSLINEYGYFGVAEDTAGAPSGLNPYVTEGRRMTDDACNLLKNHRMRADCLEGWNAVGNTTLFPYFVEGSTFYGATLGMDCSYTGDVDNPPEQGIYQRTPELPAGDYTLSVYAYASASIANTGFFLCVKDSNGDLIAKSEIVTRNFGYERIALPFTLTEGTAIDACFFCKGDANVYLSAAQLEANASASAYSMLKNADLDDNAWEFSKDVIPDDENNTSTGDETDASTGDETDASTDNKNNPKLGDEKDDYGMHRPIILPGAPSTLCAAVQSVEVQEYANRHETFMMRCWARIDTRTDSAQSESSNAPIFRLRAHFTYYDELEKAEDGTVAYKTPTEDVTLDLSTETTEWQHASLVFAKGQFKRLKNLEIFCECGNFGATAYFSDIQLLRCDFTTEMTAEELLGEAADTVAASDDAIDPNASRAHRDCFEAPEVKDEYGNVLTETLGTHGVRGTLYRTFTYSENGNDLVGESDHRGNVTEHTVDGASSRTTCTVDRTGHKTHYEYGVNGRVLRVWEGETKTGAPKVDYTYTPTGELSSIRRGDGVAYDMEYDGLHRQTAIAVRNGPTLIGYTYSGASTLPREVTYANGHRMETIYNRFGQPMAERWFNGSTEEAYYRYSYDSDGNVVRILDTTDEKEYNYLYENGRVVRFTERKVTPDENGNVIVKEPIAKVVSSYYKDATVRRLYVGDTEVLCTTDMEEDGASLARNIDLCQNGPFAKHYVRNDTLSRREFDELYLGDAHHITRTYAYCDGALPDLHKANGLERLTPTTTLVKEICISGIKEDEYTGDYRICYEYDAEDRITRMSDTLGSDITYRYDERGQLIFASTDGYITYDKYGNIMTKGGKVYTYGVGAWGDLLLAYDGQSIVYDEQGNPTTYRGHTLTWEKGRQLKSYDESTYTYNMSGLRTSKTARNVTHTYLWDGTKLLCEKWGEHMLVPLYDSEDSVCGVKYDGVAYYFVKNLQGDIIAITDAEATVVARYFYDAWGHCDNPWSAPGFDIGEINPFRYRGYYYDADTGLYYLQSRYYDPVVGRFINADTADALHDSYKLLETNLFAYCQNNPVNESDSTGNVLISVIKKILIGVFKGCIEQLGSDLISFSYNVLFVDSKSKLVMNNWDYLKTILSAVASELTSFAKNKQFIADFFVILNPYIPKFANGTMCKEEWNKLIFNLAALILKSTVLSKLEKRKKKELAQLKKYRRKNSRNINLKNQKRQIKINFKKKGVKVNLAFDATEYVLRNFLEILFSID